MTLSPADQRVLILDFGSQYTQLIARRIRELQVYCEIHPCTMPLEAIRAMRPAAIVLSGGPSSVFAKGAPRVEAGLFDLDVPMLGICYGLQLLCHTLGGKVENADRREYGPARLRIDKNEQLFKGFDAGEEVEVWMSHGDKVVLLPPGFEILAHSKDSPFAAIAHRQRRMVGVQFHPEVVHTPRGLEMLQSFLFDMAGCRPDWTPASFVDRAVEEIQQKAPEGRAVCGLSGGVDSAVAAALVSRALGRRLVCIFVDNGLLRRHESEEVERAFRGHFDIEFHRVDASDEFLSALEGISDPEAKRKTIGKVFIDVFEREALKHGDVRYLVQGTLYPDVIESVSFKGPSAVIKSHHNVGGLPERMKLGLIEPLRELFKDEVRRVGETLGLPHHVLWRQPFPGPGLAIRCLGTLSRDRLDLLRHADAIVDEEIRKADWYERVWQSFPVLLPVQTVGVMGDERTYESVIALRAVESKDGMTADWARLPYELLAAISSRIINEVPGCNRVVYDISSKPPATIEWE